MAKSKPDSTEIMKKMEELKKNQKDLYLQNKPKKQKTETSLVL